MKANIRKANELTIFKYCRFHSFANCFQLNANKRTVSGEEVPTENEKGSPFPKMKGERNIEPEGNVARGGKSKGGIEGE